MNWDKEIDKLKHYVFQKNFHMKLLEEFIIVPEAILKEL